LLLEPAETEAGQAGDHHEVLPHLPGGGVGEAGDGREKEAEYT